MSSPSGNPGLPPGAAISGMTRTQQKLMLQKDQLETQEAGALNGPSAGSAAVKFAKEIERIDREYDTVARFHDPLGAALARLTATGRAQSTAESR
ncbi:hypothetical protein GGF32_009046 [Allomyces javanicus]|nr:hypothetical protein GGF32_009046 [Allomyces javanicus]